MTENLLIGVRDPNGIRPLCLGKIKLSHGLDFANAKLEGKTKVIEPGGDPEALEGPGDAFILTSESCAIDAVNGQFLRDVEPGEIVVINKDGLQSIKYTQDKKSTCIFEYAYFAGGNEYTSVKLTADELEQALMVRCV